MLAKRFSQFVISSRTNAIMMALIFMALPLFGWLGVAVVALVTLRKGIYEGFIVLLWSALPFVVLLVAMKDWWPFLIAIGFNAVVVWLLAIVYQRYHRWALTIEISALLGVLIVCCIHLFVGDLQHWWLVQFVQEMKMAHLHIDQALIAKTLGAELKFMTGIMVSLIVFADVCELMLGQYFNSLLLEKKVNAVASLKQFTQKTFAFLNRKAFKETADQWTEWRLSLTSIVVLLIGAVLAWFGPAIFKDIFPVLLMPFLWAGLSLMHGFLNHWKLSNVVIALVYVVLVLLLMFVPVLLGVFIIVAILDSFFDFRKRLEM
ncbi:MAG: hypothetical protein ABIH77_01680 [Pseudomonadota bacterium]|nr:hypothetical protein [Gammaproteobacteria bacterium]MBU1628728.1 hypothetical protein [Gammaproteobacteria bacterium]MBU1927003.1 hypothetical protein [Gammaproteobacteria bacterium]MBU2546002.1 hypothetical protein [Gammaproteobacteria bacterium]